MPYDSGSDNSAWVNYMIENEGFKEDRMISPMCEPNEEGGFGHKKCLGGELVQEIMNTN